MRPWVACMFSILDKLTGPILLGVFYAEDFIFLCEYT